MPPAAWLNTALLLAFTLCACDRESAAPAAAASPGPGDSLKRLLAAREAGHYRDVEDCIVPEQAAALTDFIRSVDSFLLAESRVKRAVLDRIGVGYGGEVDLSALKPALGFLAGQVSVLDVAIRDRSATLSVQIDGRVPPEELEMRLVNGRWRLDPGPGYDPVIARAFGAMAGGLNALAADLEAGRITAEEIMNDRNKLPLKVQTAIGPGLAMLSEARQRATTRAAQGP